MTRLFARDFLTEKRSMCYCELKNSPRNWEGNFAFLEVNDETLISGKVKANLSKSGALPDTNI